MYNPLRIGQHKLALRCPIITWNHRIAVKTVMFPRFRVKREARLAFPKTVNTQIGSDPVYPCGELHRIVITVKVLVDTQEGFLYGILRFLTII
ncbi:hypothetical protein D3C85_1364080 [compost metagenome]